MSNSWDKFLLLVVALAVIGLSGLFVAKALGFAENFEMQPATPDDTIPTTEAQQAVIAQKFVDQQITWTTPKIGAGNSDVPLLVSIPIVEKNGELINMINPNDPPIRPPVSNAWLIANNLDFLNGGVLQQDPDADGFDNIAEWDAKTDPQDPASHPPYADKLVMVERKAKVYALKFSARPDQERFQVQRLATPAWPQRDSFYLRVGDVSEDKQFRLDSFEERQAQRNGINVDASVLNITYLPKEEKVQLIRNIDTAIPTYYAQLQFLLEPGALADPIKEGDSFNLLRDPETKYRVIEVKEDSTIISYQTGSEPEQTVEIKKK